MTDSALSIAGDFFAAVKLSSVKPLDRSQIVCTVYGPIDRPCDLCGCTKDVQDTLVEVPPVFAARLPICLQCQQDTNLGKEQSMAELRKCTLGMKYKDKLLGIEGVAMSRVESLGGEPQVTLKWLKGGEVKSGWFLESELELMPGQDAVAEKDPGGPTESDTPPRS